MPISSWQREARLSPSGQAISFSADRIDRMERPPHCTGCELTILANRDCINWAGHPVFTYVFSVPTITSLATVKSSLLTSVESTCLS